jgi:hypothetical protein
VLKRPSTGNCRVNLVATNGQVIATSLATVLQAALSPVASSVGTDLKPAIRAPLDTMVHWDPVGGRFGGDQDLPARPLRPPHRGGRECDRFAVVGASDAPWSR